jgi:hypothetical protein
MNVMLRATVVPCHSTHQLHEARLTVRLVALLAVYL